MTSETKAWARRFAVNMQRKTLLAGVVAAAVMGAGFRDAPSPESAPLLGGRTIVIDPGHGGLDPGSLGLRTRECDLNLALAKRLAVWFRGAGAKVILTWSDPWQLPATRRLNVRQRVALINGSRAEVLIDIHCNAGGAYRGPQTFYWGGQASYTLAKMVQDELQDFTHTRRRVSRINQYVLRYARMPAINVEVGFITNPSEEGKLMDPTYQSQLTKRIFTGTERWFLHAPWPVSLHPEPTDMEMLRR